MSPRNSFAEARRTRASILERAVEVSSVEGLEGVTIGRLAGDLDMSKSGVIGHFGTKESLQLATLEAALDVFRREVWERASGKEPGLPRLLALCDAWTSYLRREVFPGGCFLTAAAAEFDGRGGPVRQAVADALELWYRVLEAEVRTAVEAGDLPRETDPRDVALQLNALAMAANQRVQLLGDRAATASARRLMRAVLSA
ncbi:MAG TPA: TetR/AcrR family transcriptional regulator [Solirubrobacteraceae bacterium]